MSFLPPLDNERETLATLEVALAFIDACEQQQGEEIVWPRHTQPSESKKPGSARVRNGVTTKKMTHRERVRAELQQLRHEAAALELWLMNLKVSHAYSSSTGSGERSKVARSILPHSSNLMATSSQWMEIVVREFQRRKLSETRNHKLKALLKRLAKAAKSPEQALANPLTQEEIMLVYEPVEALSQRPNRSDDAMELLVDRLTYLELNLATLLERAGLVDVESSMFHSQRKVDQTLGLVFECASSTPLPHSIAETDSVVLSFQQNTDTNACTMKTDPSMKSYQATFQLEGRQYVTRGIMRKIVKADQIIYVWSSESRLTDKGLIMKEEGLTRICSPSPSQSGSQLQTWYVAYMPQCASPSTGDTTMAVSGKMLRAHTNKMTTFMQQLADILQDETEGKPLERVHSACTLAISEFDLVYS